jgi:hypothetical protein
MKLTEEQQKAVKGIRVEEDTIVIRMNGGVKYGNDRARKLCGDLLEALNVEPADDEYK